MLKSFNIVRVSNDHIYVLLEVTKSESDLYGMPGLYAFKGMWYGNDPIDKNSYGKVTKVKESEVIEIMVDDIREISLEYAQNLLGRKL